MLFSASDVEKKQLSIAKKLDKGRLFRVSAPA